MKTFKNHIDEAKRGASTMNRLRDMQAKSNAMAAKPKKKPKDLRKAELDETSSEKLAKYANKAKYSMDRAKNSALASTIRGDKDDFEKSTNTMSKRERGLKLAKDRAINKFRQAVKDKKEN